MKNAFSDSQIYLIHAFCKIIEYILVLYLCHDFKLVSIQMNLRFFTFISIVMCVGLILFDSYFNSAYTNVAGAIAARCGSVADPLTCSNCHAGGPNTIQTGWITSNIPFSGYIPGDTYTITATATFAGRSKFGFEISPQDPISNSSSRGTCIVTDAVSTKLITGSSGRKYMTHQSAGTTGTADFHTWTFDWTAPATGIDSVLFYGAFLCSNSSNNSSGDITYKSSLTVYRDITTLVDENRNDGFDFSIFPNPASDRISVNYRIHTRELVDIKLFDYNGRLVASLMSEFKAPGECSTVFKLPSTLTPGMYILEISTESNRMLKRILVQQ